MTAPVLVTGASGFIGGCLARRLAAAGEPVRATSRRRPEGFPPGVELVAADLLDPHALPALVAGVSTVIHVAGQLGGTGVSDETLRAVNAEAPVALLRAAAAAGARRFVHVSSVGVLGETGSRPAREDDPPRPASAYERTKWQGESGVLAEGEARGLPVVVIRPALVYGPGDHHLLPLWKALRGPVFPLIDGGRALTHPVHVDDVASALADAARREPAPVGVFHVAGDRPVPYRELLAGIARALGRRPPRLSMPRPLASALAAMLETAFGLAGRTPPLTRERVRLFCTSRTFATDRIRERMGWRPRIGLDEGLAATTRWYLDHGWL